MICVSPGGCGFVGGTSLAAPLWAGFAALVNQQAATNGVAPMGFANPTFYAIGETRLTGNNLYASTFHDVNDGVFNQAPFPNSSNQGHPAVNGYDLATGWGSPSCNLLQLLASQNPIAPPTYSNVSAMIQAGIDGANAPTILNLTLSTPTGALGPFTLKEAGDNSWTQGQVHYAGTIILPTAMSPSAITGVTVTMDENGQTFPDNFDIGGFHVWMSDVSRPSACLVDLSGDLSCDTSQPSCTSLGTLADTADTGVARLSSSNDCLSCSGDCTCGSGQGLTATFGTASSGNPDATDHCNGVFQAGPPLDPIDTVEFIVDTFDDGLDSGNVVTVSLLDSTGATITSTQLNPGGVALPNGTEKSVPLPNVSKAVAKIQLDVAGGDTWHVSGIRAVGRRTMNGGALGQERCLYRYAADATNPPIVFDGSNTSYVAATGACN